ncbi:MAG: diguanylate cyclase [Christensenellales bacterium]
MRERNLIRRLRGFSLRRFWGWHGAADLSRTLRRVGAQGQVLVPARGGPRSGHIPRYPYPSRDGRVPAQGNVFGRSLKMSKVIGKANRTICAMIGDVSYDFSTELMRGLFDTAEKEGVRLLYLIGMPRHTNMVEGGSPAGNGNHHNSIYDYAYLVGADAFIFSCGSLSGFESRHMFEDFLKHYASRPYVVLQENMQTTVPGKSCITIDNISSYTQCIEHLIVVHQRRKIGFLAGPKGHPDGDQRMLAYRQTMEKHGLPIEDSMIAYGDFSEFSDAQALKLIKDNPGLDAIASCNDEMAKGCYRVCAQLGLRVGKDIAITGFDNYTTSRSMIPPLTTVSQSTYLMGKMAVMQAIDLMDGKLVEPVELSTKFHIRRSCGCYPDTVSHLFGPADKDQDISIDGLMKTVSADLVNAYADSERERSGVMVAKFVKHVRNMLNGEPLQASDKIQFADWMHQFAEEYDDATFLLAKRLNDYVVQLPSASLNNPVAKRLYDISLFAQGLLFSFRADLAERSLDEFRSQAWFIPEFIRDLIDSDLEDGHVFLDVVKRLHSINLDHIYICLLPEPLPLRDSGSGVTPNKLLLAAYQSDALVQAYPLSQMPVIDAACTLRSLPALDSSTHLMSFSIFSGDVQYGILMCEAEMSKCNLLHVIGLQLGMLISFLELKRKEEIVAGELDNIRERNEILNFLSEFDPLCNILNRRGFIERAFRLNREHTGELAICVFVDLDHLKEINDIFGHSEGDKALLAVSDILQKTVRSNDLVARIGGDEFVCMFVIEDPSIEGIFRERLQRAFVDYNKASESPYYVDASVGIICFKCDHGLDVGKIVSTADQAMYQEKKHKRANVLKSGGSH